MKPTYTLTKFQRKLLIEELKTIEDGQFDYEVEIDNILTLYLKGSIKTDGYRESDYLNGTGAWVETSREAEIEIGASLNDNETKYTVDNFTQKIAYNFLNRKI